MNDKLLLKGFIYSIISALCYACLAIFVKIGYENGLSTQTMLTFRFLFAAISMFLIFALTNIKILKANINTIFNAFILGSILYTAQSFFFFESLKYVSASITELLLYIYPAAVTLLSSVIFKEKLRRIKIFYILLIIIGFAFIFGDAFYSRLELKGVIFGLCAMLTYSFFLILSQKFTKKGNPLTLAFYTILFAAASFSAIHLPKDIFNMNINQYVIILSMSLISTTMAVLFLYKAVNTIGASLTGVFSSIEPVATIILSIIFLSDKLSLYQFTGGIIIIIGIVIANIYNLKTKKEPSQS